MQHLKRTATQQALKSTWLKRNPSPNVFKQVLSSTRWRLERMDAEYSGWGRWRRWRLLQWISNSEIRAKKERQKKRENISMDSNNGESTKCTVGHVSADQERGLRGKKRRHPAQLVPFVFDRIHIAVVTRDTMESEVGIHFLQTSLQKYSLRFKTSALSDPKGSSDLFSPS